MTQGPSDGRSRFEQQAEGALDVAMKAFGRARVRAGELAHEHRGKIDQALERAGRLVDDKTGGKYHDTVEKLKAQAVKGVDLVENERHGGAPAACDPASATGPGSATGTTAGSPPMASPIPPYTPPQAAAGAPATGTPATGTPEQPSDAARGWHRGRNGEWVRDEPAP